jgi:DNA modification methylase
MIELHNDNSFEFMKGLEDNSFDFVLTDPPYDFTDEQWNELIIQLKRICRGDLIIFCDPEREPPMKADRKLFWAKPTSTKNYSKSYGRFVEEILLYIGDEHKWNTDLQWSNYTGLYDDKVQVLDHPYKKPLSLLERFILIHTDVGDKIFEPFAGGGSTLLAAMRLGRHCVGVELDKDKFDIAAKTLSETQMEWNKNIVKV